MLKVFLLPILVWPLMAGAQDSYLCVADKDTGFLINNGEWDSTNFTPYKYLIRRSKVPAYAWEVIPIGTSVSIANCKIDFDKDGYLMPI